MRRNLRIQSTGKHRARIPEDRPTLDVMNRLKATLVPKCHLVRRCRPSAGTADRVEVSAVVSDYGARSDAPFLTSTERHNIDHVRAIRFHPEQFSEVIAEIAEQ